VDLYLVFKINRIQEKHQWQKRNAIQWKKLWPCKKKLRSLPAKVEGKTKAEVVACLEKDIRKALAQGYNLKDIQVILAEEGIQAPLSRMAALTEKVGGDTEQGHKIEDGKAEECAAVSSPVSAPLKAEKVSIGLFKM
jgi:hypothetical protein